MYCNQELGECKYMHKHGGCEYMGGTACKYDEYLPGDRVVVAVGGVELSATVITYDSDGVWWAAELQTDRYGYQYIKSADGAIITHEGE